MCRIFLQIIFDQNFVEQRPKNDFLEKSKILDLDEKIDFFKIEFYA